jgi:hypothetical protein
LHYYSGGFDSEIHEMVMERLMITLTREEAQRLIDALLAWEEECSGYGWSTNDEECVALLRAKLSEPEIAQFKFQEYGPDNWGDSQVTKPEFVAEQKATNEALRSMVKQEPVLPGGGIGRHPDIQARKEGDLIVADLPQVPRGSGGIRTDPTIDGWPLYSGLPTPPDNFIDAIRYNTAISQGDQRIDPTKIYKEPEPEPVAYINIEERKLEWATPIKWETPTVVKMDKVPLYTASPQHESAPTKLMIVPALLEHAGYVKKKEWVGLTEKETIDLALNAFALPEVSLEQRLRLHQELVIAMNEPDSRLMIFAATIEQALQEKNT